MLKVVLYHNPKCATSRNALALLREHGVEPEVVPYLTTGWTLDLLTELIHRMGVPARDILRLRGTDAAARGLADPGVAEATLLRAMVADPILVERPIVVSAKGAALCRPAERVLDLI